MSQLVSVAVPVPLDRVFTYRVPLEMESVRLGARVIVPFGRRTLRGVVVDTSAKLEGDHALRDITKLVDAEPLFDPDYLRLADWVSRQYVAGLGETLQAMLPGAQRAREVADSIGDEPLAAAELELSDEQQTAVAALVAEPAGGAAPPAWFYLYGITGSGKTEVFLRAAQIWLERGKTVLYLVPEITLSHQLFAQLRKRFGSLVALLHSGLTASQRLGEWQRIRTHEARFVVGARSAVFAPVDNLGLVVVDEEHDGSYKAGSNPRYSARQVALWRAKDAGAVCVLGSATPSVEAWHLMQAGSLQALRLTRRLSGGALPQVRIKDMSRSVGLLSSELVTALRETKALGAQSILFLNRRGFAPVLACRSCDYEFGCSRCSAPMTYHKERHALVCHYCGNTAAAPQVCPNCGSLDLAFGGAGTERIEEELAREVPELTVARLDADSTRKRGSLAELLDRFASGDYDVLVGTQMVAKGLNFPRVRTVGIVSADTGLSMPDFRAAERTFALIVQVAGRAGRFRDDGTVIVQTSRPRHPAIAYAVAGAMEEFYRSELDLRRELHFPPFVRMLRLVFRSPERSRAQRAAAHAGALLTERGRDPAGFDILGPVAAPLERIAGQWRTHLILRGTSAERLGDAVRNLRTELALPHTTHMEIDVDPVDLL